MHTNELTKNSFFKRGKSLVADIDGSIKTKTGCLFISGDRFARHIDLSHTVHNESDELKRHRALLIKQPTIELSGTYTCKVSTFVDEDVQQKKMVIYCKSSIKKVVSPRVAARSF